MTDPTRGELATDRTRAIMALQAVRTHHHIYEVARLGVISAVQNAVMFGAGYSNLADIVGPDALVEWVPNFVTDPSMPDYLDADLHRVDNPATGWSEAEWTAEHDPTA